MELCPDIRLPLRITHYCVVNDLKSAADITTNVVTRRYFLRFFSNSEANVTELLKHTLKKTFLNYT